MTDVVAASARSSSGDSCALSLGQVSVWRDIRELHAEVQARTVLADSFSVAPHTGERDLRCALEQLAARHEILRTRFERGDAGARPRQRILALEEVELPLTCEEVGDEANPLARLRRRPLPLWTGLPWSAALVTRGGVADHVVVVVHHLGTDAHGLTVLVQDLARLLAGEALADTTSHGARTLVELETRSAGLRSAERALRRWRSALAEGFPPAPDHDRVLEATLRSCDLRDTVVQRSEEERVPVSAVLLHAFVSALERTDGDGGRRVLRTMVSNRLGEDRARLVTSMNQWAPIVLPVEGASLAEVARELMLAMRAGVYDVEELERVLGAEGLDPRDLDFLPSFNLVQLAAAPVDSGGARPCAPCRGTHVQTERMPLATGPRFYFRALWSDQLRLVLRVPEEPDAEAVLQQTLLLIERRLRSA